MKLSESIKPISYLKAHASEIIREVYENKKTFIITQNGYAKVVIYSLEDYENDLRKISSLKAELLKQANDNHLKKIWSRAKKTTDLEINKGKYITLDDYVSKRTKVVRKVSKRPGRKKND